MSGLEAEKHKKRIDDKNTHQRHTKQFEHEKSIHAKHVKEEAHIHYIEEDLEEVKDELSET